MDEIFYIGLMIVAITLGVMYGPTTGFLVLGGGFIFSGLINYLN